MENRAFYPEKMQPPLGLYAHGVEVPEDAKLTFVAGQVGMDFDGNIPDDFETQARNAWNNCLAVLEHNRLRSTALCPSQTRRRPALLAACLLQEYRCRASSACGLAQSSICSV